MLKNGMRCCPAQILLYTRRKPRAVIPYAFLKREWMRPSADADGLKPTYGVLWKQTHFNWRTNLFSVFTTPAFLDSRPCYAGPKTGNPNHRQHSFRSRKSPV